MRYLIIGLMLLMTALFVNAQDTAAQDAHANTALAAQLTKLNTMQANFQQTSYDSTGKVLQQSSGTMAMARPGKFRWQSLTPNNQLIIADGRYIWVYDADLQQATRQTQQQNTPTFNPASLLSGSIASLQQQFSVKQTTQDNHQVFQLTPHNKNGFFQRIELFFQQEQLTKMQMTDNLGQSSVFTFSNVKLNSTLDQGLFQFKAPKGTDIIAQ